MTQPMMVVVHGPHTHEVHGQVSIIGFTQDPLHRSIWGGVWEYLTLVIPFPLSMFTTTALCLKRVWCLEGEMQK